MSDLERLNLRDLPPVEPLAGWPERYSQTLLRHADSCMRAAYLYVKYRGGAPGHQLDRGTAAHAVFERMALALIEQGERTLYATAEGEDPMAAAQEVASLSAAFVDEVRRERPDLTVPVGEWDAVRVMAYHWALATELEIDKVVAVERKFVLDVAGHEISGIVDLALIDGDVAEVRDYKTNWAPPEQDAYERSFQPRLYALLLAFGQPVERVECSECFGSRVERHDEGLGERCPVCKGRGYGERRLDPIGDRIQWVRTREQYPRLLRDTGELQERKHVLSRTDLQDFRGDLEALVVKVDQARESGSFPAVGGSHCSECPAPAECPLPEHLRNFAGSINSPEEAAEAAEWVHVTGQQVSATTEELRRFAKAHGPIRYGRDRVREFVASESRSVKRRGKASDWDGLERAVLEAAHFGKPFQVADWVRSSVSNRFVDRALSAEELAAESEQGGNDGGVGDLDERFGAEAPW